MKAAGNYCSPEMAQLMGDFGDLLNGVHFVRESVMTQPYTDYVVAKWYVPVQRDVKAELEKLVLKSHELGYTEAVGDWG